MAEEHVKSVVVNFVETSDGTRSVIELEADTTTTSENSNFFTAKEELSSTITKDSAGCATLSNPAPSSLEYFSTRIQSMLESRTAFASSLEAEIESSKEHWSELQLAGNGEDGSTRSDFELFRSLQKQWPNGFFEDWNKETESRAVGEKIAEGAQAEIFELRFLLPETARFNDRFVLKVFKEGSSLQDLQKQWPQGMLVKASTSEGAAAYLIECASSLSGGMMLKDGRFAFAMYRWWGDLRKVIDLRMVHNRNQGPPFRYSTSFWIMFNIARGMGGLHQDNIVHRDLKASNVLIGPGKWEEKPNLPEAGFVPRPEFDPISDDKFMPLVADFECSLGVWGTRFWRAPEILLGLKNRDVQASLFTEKSDVYSYAMTCYEILTGKIPLEDLKLNDYDAVLLQGARPMLPHGIKPWIKSLLTRCWDHDPFQRPSFKEILGEFNGHLKK